MESCFGRILNTGQIIVCAYEINDQSIDLKFVLDLTYSRGMQCITLI